jgi:hypothetical protein
MRYRMGFALAIMLFSGAPARSCCMIPPDLVTDLDFQARAKRGAAWYEESDRAYQLRYNRIFISLLADQRWDVLAGLQAESDDELCEGSCRGTDKDIRRLLDAAVTLKSAKEVGNWNWKLFTVGIVSALIALGGLIATVAGIIRFPAADESRFQAIKSWLRRVLLVLADELPSSSQVRATKRTPFTPHSKSLPNRPRIIQAPRKK